MIRSLNVLAILALIGSATMAYQVKYETILVNEKLRKQESALQREKDAIAVLKAEWELLNRPSRLQALAQPEAGMQMLTVRQIAKPTDIPQAPKQDEDKIAAALDGLMTGGLPGDAARRASPRPGAATLAATPRPQVKTATPVTPRPGLPARPGLATRTDTAAGAKPKVTGLASAEQRAQPVPQASTAPMMLRPPAPIGATRGAQPAPAPRRDPIGDALGALFSSGQRR